MALLRRVLLVGAVAVGAMSPAACSGDGDGGAPTPGAGAPVSADPPQSGRASVVAPSEPREPLLGDAVVVVDSAARVVYEFDLGRMRFRGPAPRVATLDGPVTLAGYPTLVSKETAQDAATVGPTVVVAGGREGTAVFLDRSKGDLAVADILQLPLRNVVADDTGKRSSNATAGKPNPYVTLVSRLGADDVLVVSKDRETGTSVGYALEVADRSLVNGVQLPGGGEAAAVQPYADGAVAAMSSRKLVLLTRELASAREIALPGVPTHLVVDGDVAWVSITKPARLVRVDLRRGGTRVVATEARDEVGGPVAVGDGAIWWALTERAVVRRLGLPGAGKAKDLRACGGISAMARHEKKLLLTCPGTRTFGVIADDKPMVAYKAGNYPISIAGPPT